jgi:hypothetical protein
MREPEMAAEHWSGEDDLGCFVQGVEAQLPQGP